MFNHMHVDAFWTKQPVLSVFGGTDFLHVNTTMLNNNESQLISVHSKYAVMFVDIRLHHVGFHIF